MFDSPKKTIHAIHIARVLLPASCCLALQFLKQATQIIWVWRSAEENRRKGTEETLNVGNVAVGAGVAAGLSVLQTADLKFSKSRGCFPKSENV